MHVGGCASEQLDTTPYAVWFDLRQELLPRRSPVGFEFFNCAVELIAGQADVLHGQFGNLNLCIEGMDGAEDIADANAPGHHNNALRVPLYVLR